MQVRASVVAPTIALFLATFVAAMDVSIIATALPTVVGELGGLPLFGWAVAAYLLTSTVSMPLYGSVADRYGRRPVTIAALGLFLLGSLLGGFANSMPELIAFRALQGLGGGGILTLTATIAGDLYPLEQRARVEGIISGIWGLAAIVGPLIGSIIVSQTSWRWVFWINPPLALVAAAILAVAFHERDVARRRHTDYLGAVLLTAGLTTLLLALVQGGREGFAGPLVLGLLAAAAVLLALFGALERRVPDPVVPLRLLRQRVLGLTSLGGLVLGACTYGATFYLPLFVQGAQGGTARDAGLATATISVGWTVGSLLGGRALLELGLQSAALLGLGLLSLGGTLLALLGSATPLAVVAVSGLVLGLGLGIAATVFIVAVQSASAWEERGEATALQELARSIGGTVWVSAQGAVLGAVAGAALATASVQVPAGSSRLDALNAMLAPGARATLAPEQARVLVGALEAGLHQGFVLLLAIALVGLGIVGFLPARVPRSSSPDGPSGSQCAD
jgi:EmrB/QacA subfamily drug resistance transporter